jgi:hypothetical protein
LAENDEAGKWLNAKVRVQKAGAQMQEDTFAGRASAPAAFGNSFNRSKGD